MNDETYHMNPSLFAIYDAELETGVVLNEDRGLYWRLDRMSLSILKRLATRGASTLADLNREQGSDLSSAVGELENIGLVVRGPRDYVPASRCEPNQAWKTAVSPKHVAKHDILPSFLMVAEYVATNVCIRVILAIHRWAPVRKRRAAMREGSNKLGTTLQREIAEEIIACMRIASPIPLVSRSCIPRALTAYEMLRRRDFPARLVIGAYVEPFEPHIWVSCGDEVIDSGHIDFSLDVFVPLPELALDGPGTGKTG